MFQLNVLFILWNRGRGESCADSNNSSPGVREKCRRSRKGQMPGRNVAETENISHVHPVCLEGTPLAPVMLTRETF